jgi:pimeloyl-ACP methyl ester carboxylesterase
VYATIWAAAAVIGLTFAFLGIRALLIIRQYGPPIRRIFEEDPIFVPTAASAPPVAEQVEFQTPEGLTLRGSYLKATGEDAKGVIVFCPEFRSDRWSGLAYFEFLQRDGFDIFTFEFRNHGESDKDPAYAPRHWVTNYELDDLEAALTYLKTRPGSAQLPMGLFGISRGGGTAIGVAARDRSVRCVVTDGAFPTHSTMLAYMKKWVTLVVGEKSWARLLPDWYLVFVRNVVLAEVERDLGCHFAKLERAIRRIAPRPILMIHGGRDSYIRPDIARQFFDRALDPRDLWIVEGARHNACLDTAGEEYRRRVVDFFRENLK